MSYVQKKLSDQGWALLPLRLMVGFGFAAHGYAKLSRGPQTFSVILAAVGVPHPHVMAWITALLEFLGGISVMAGAFVLPLSFPLVVVMLTAMITVHLQYGFSSVRLKAITASGAQFGPIGYEMNLLYIAGLLTLAMCGPGKLSVDHFLSGRTYSANDDEGARALPTAEQPYSSGPSADNTISNNSAGLLESRAPDSVLQPSVPAPVRLGK